MNAAAATVTVYAGDRLGDYSFGDDHPFRSARYAVFMEQFYRLGLDQQCRVAQPVMARRAEIERFHTAEYVDAVIRAGATGDGFLDGGDTPAFRGVDRAAAWVVGTVLQAVGDLVEGRTKRAFVPIAGLHHARRNSAAGFCVYNDCGVAIETLRSEYGVERIAYVDIDAHHGDGVFYSFESDPGLAIADIHEDGRYLYPGTGAVTEAGKGEAHGTKLNVPMQPDSGDQEFFEIWDYVESFIDKARPEFIVFQCGADGLAGDPITHLAYTSEVHRHATLRLCELANRHCQGRLLALGGGGYNLSNVANAWCMVVRAMSEAKAFCPRGGDVSHA